MKFPTIKQITDKVISYRDYLKNNFNSKDIKDEEGNAGADIRLQIRELTNTDGGSVWQIHTGDSSYDQDHRGFWGASSVGIDATNKDCSEIAKDLIEQAKEHYYQIVTSRI